MHKLQCKTERTYFNWIGWMAWSRRIRMGVAVAVVVWCTSCESMGSEIMEVPVTTVLLDTHVQCSLYIIYSILFKRKSGSKMMAVPPLWWTS